MEHITYKLVLWLRSRHMDKHDGSDWGYNGKFDTLF